MMSLVRRINETPFLFKLFLTLLGYAVILIVGTTILTHTLVIGLYKRELGYSYIEKVKIAGTLLNAWEEETERNALILIRRSSPFLNELVQLSSPDRLTPNDYSIINRLNNISILLEEMVMTNNLYSTITLLYDNFDYRITQNYTIRKQNNGDIERYAACIAENKHWITENNTLAYVFPIMAYGLNPKGIIVFTINEIEMNKVINANTEKDMETIFILDEKGTIISDANKKNIGKNISTNQAIVSVFSDNLKEGQFISKANGSESLTVFWLSELNNWYYCSFISMNEINHKTNAISILIGLIAFGFVFLITAFSYPLAKKLYTPIKKMEFNLEDYTLFQLVHNNNKESKLINTSLLRFFIHPCFCSVVLSPDFSYRRYREGIINNIDDNWVISSAVNILSSQYFCRGFSLEWHNMTIIINAESFDIVFLETALRKLQELFFKKFNFTLSIGVGKATSLEDISTSYNSACRVLLNRLTAGFGCLEFFSDNPNNIVDNYFYPIELENIIFNNLSLNFYDKTIEATNAFFLELKKKRELSIDNMILILNQLMDNIIHYIIEKHIDIREIFDNDINFYYKLPESETIDEIEIYVTEVFRKIINFELEYHAESRKGINRILAYIDTNINKTFDITAMSDSLGLSYSHVRRVFSQEIGGNLLDYVYKKKIEITKTMLKDTKLSSDEISKRAGFYNRQSFYHFFKKYEGITPKNFRQMALEK